MKSQLEFVEQEDTIFTYPDENDANHEVQNYIKELAEIIETYK